MNKKILVLISTLVAIFSVQAISLAVWTGPTLTPPFGNLPPPLNLSSTEQTKPGTLVLGGFPYGLIIQTGKVGIGTSVPEERLEVSGNIRIGKNARISATNSVDAVANLMTFDADNFLRLGVSGGNGIILVSSIAGNIGAYANNLYSIGNESSRFSNIYGVNGWFGTGIGLGVTSQDSNFKITTTAGGVKAENNDATNPAGYFKNYGAGPSLTVDGTVKITGGTPGSGKVLTSDASGNATWAVAAGGISTSLTRGNTIVGDDSGTAQATSTIYMTSAGNVGIGTTAPSSKLQVVGGGIKVAGASEFYNTVAMFGTAPYLYVGSGAGQGQYGYMYWNDTSKALEFIGTQGTGVAMTIKSGAVGIANTNPADTNYKLTVGSSATANSGLKAETSSASQPAGYFNNGSTGPSLVTGTGNVGIGISNPVFETVISGAGQSTPSFADAGNKGSALLLSDQGYLAGSGGALLFGGTGGNGYFGAIKGLLANGTTNSTGDIVISTRNAVADTSLTERFRVMGGGNVGVAEIAPGSKFSVNGGVAIGDDVAYSRTAAAPAGGLIVKGNVGIGTTAPAAKLQVVGGGIKVAGASEFYNTVALFGASSQFYMGSSAGQGQFAALAWNDTSKALEFGIQGSANAMTIKGSNVGIGTSDPNGKLQVGANLSDANGSISGATTPVRLIVNGATSPALTLGYYSSGYGLDMWVGTTGLAPVYFDQRNKDAFIFRVFTGTTPTEVMRINGYNSTAGNVGIGVTAPAQKLSVAGTIESTTGGFKFPDGTTQTTAGGSGWTAGTGTVYATNTSDAVGVGITSPDTSYKLTTVGGGIKTKGADSGAVNFSLYAENSDGVVLAVRNDGKVGIGTAAPATTLDINKAGANLQLYNSTQGGAGEFYLGSRQTVGNSKYFDIVHKADDATNGAMYFVPNSTTISNAVLSIQSGGNVGIGTTVPGATLDVRGNVYLGNQWSNTDVYVTGGAGWGLNLHGDVAYSSITDQRGLLKLGSNGVAGQMVLTGGNVGIGTTAPATTLDIARAGADANYGMLVLRDTTSMATGVGGVMTFMGYKTAQTNYGIFAKIKGLKENSTLANEAGYLSFETNNNTAYAEAMRITSAGKVGIGTTAPVQRLDVVGTVASAANIADYSTMSGIHIQNNTDTAGSATGIFFEPHSVGWNNVNAYSGIVAIRGGTDGYDSNLAFITRGNAVVASEKMRITNAGNVGIGTTNPIGKLSLVGGSTLRFGNDGDSGNNQIYLRGGATGDKADITMNNYGFGSHDVMEGYAGNGLFSIGRDTTASNNHDFVINGSGNIGIGLTSPDSNYKITTTAGGVKADNSSASQPAIYASNAGGGPALVTSSGSVGVGTGSPEAGLDVGAGDILVRGTSGYLSLGHTANLYFGDIGDTPVDANRTYIRKTNGDALTLNTNSGVPISFSFAGAEKVRIDSTGKVGIGTTAPTAKLDIVAGAARSGTHGTSPSLYVTASMGEGKTGPESGNIEFRHDNGTQGIGFGYNTIYQTGSNTNQTLNLLSRGNLPITLNAYSYSTGNVGIGTTAPLSKLSINGGLHVGGDSDAGDNNILADGTVTATAFYYSSDKSLKNNIKPLSGSLEKILQLQGVSFNWKNDNSSSIGVIAQDVEKIYPELVSTNKETGLKSVEYANLVAPLIESVKEQQKQIEELKAEIQELKNK